MSHVHVKDTATGHEYVVPEHLFNPEAHEKTGKPAQTRSGDLAPVKFKTTVSKEAARKSGQKRSAQSGQTAETDKE